jgi:hypothetical protein
MRRLICCLAVVFLSVSLWACGSTPEETEGSYRQMPNIKMRVVDVSNSTAELFDVDVIGMLWSSLDDSLKRRGMLWPGEAAYAPYKIEAQILQYKKGSAWYRWALPMWGNTDLVVKCDVIKDGHIIATVEAQKEVSFGDGTFTRNAWRKVFSEIAEDLIVQIVARL